MKSAPSIAKRTAFGVVENSVAGKRANVYQIALKNGASDAYARSGNIQKTAEYKEIVDSALDKMKRIREKNLDALLKKDPSEEKYDTLVRSAVALTHDVQLLSGGKTENISVEEDRRLLIGIVQQLRISSDDSQ